MGIHISSPIAVKLSVDKLACLDRTGLRLNLSFTSSRSCSDSDGSQLCYCSELSQTWFSPKRSLGKGLGIKAL